MALQTFTAGQVLTAAQMTALQTNAYNQTVSTKTASYTLVAADVGTRIVMNSASATTITVNTSLFSAGDTVFLQNLTAGGVCTITAGTCTVTTSGSLALAANAGGTLYFTSASAAVFIASGVAATASGLTFISTTSFSSATSFSLPANTFTSTYTRYKVFFSTAASVTGGNLTMRYRAAGSDITSADYYGALLGRVNAGTNIEVSNNNATASSLGFFSDTSTFKYGFEITLFNPTSTDRKAHTILGNSSKTDFGGLGFVSGGGILNSVTSCDSLTFINSVASSMSGTCEVYGLQKS